MQFNQLLHLPIDRYFLTNFHIYMGFIKLIPKWWISTDFHIQIGFA